MLKLLVRAVLYVPPDPNESKKDQKSAKQEESNSSSAIPPHMLLTAPIDNYRCTALAYAVAFRQIECVKYLLSVRNSEGEDMEKNCV